MIKLTDFFKTDFVDYASYDNLRKIASCIDGQKNAARKVLYTVLEKNIKEKIKVSQLGSKVAEYAEYLHGNLDGVVVNLAQDFTGSNNLPLLQKKGNFGTRLVNEASASRYIFTYGSDVFFKIFKKEDNSILNKQFFEGMQIEPQFYVPSLPLIVINGSEGVSSGFAQKILPRSTKNVIKYIKDYLRKGSANPKLLHPYYNGFTGEIVVGETPAQWLIKGKIERINKTTILISELPIGYDLKTYKKILDNLEDNKTILSYKDMSDNDRFKFEIKMLSKELDSLSEEDILNKLKLIKTVTENYTCIDIFNRIKVFNDIYEIINYYIDVKKRFLSSRKENLINDKTVQLSLITSKIFFIKLIIDKSLIIEKRSKESIIQDLEKYDKIVKYKGNYDYLLNMPIYSLTKEKLLNLNNEFKECKNYINTIKHTSIEDLWFEDLSIL